MWWGVLILTAHAECTKPQMPANEFAAEHADYPVSKHAHDPLLDSLPLFQWAGRTPCAQAEIH